MGTSEKYHRQTPVLLSVRFSVCWFFSLFFFVLFFCYCFVVGGRRLVCLFVCLFVW